MLTTSKSADEGCVDALAPVAESAETRAVDDVPSRNLTISLPATYLAPLAPARSGGPFSERIDSRTRASGASGARYTRAIRPRSIAGIAAARRAVCSCPRGL
jgi:hypothetical protein